jgi:hypothetical protein
MDHHASRGHDLLIGGRLMVESGIGSDRPGYDVSQAVRSLRSSGARSPRSVQ